MTDRALSLRDRTKGDLIGLAIICFLAGTFMMTGLNYLIGGNLMGWIYAVLAVIMVAGAIFVGRRMLSRMS